MPTTTLRDRRREQLRREIAEAALALAEQHGWAQVTVSQLAAEVGISRRAFFTHFGSKDDAIVYGACDDLEFLADALDSRAAGTTFLDVLRANLDVWIDEMSALGTTRRRRQQVEREQPEIAGKIATARAAALRTTALPHLAADLGLTEDDPLVDLVASAFAGIGSALDRLFAAETDAGLQTGAARDHVVLSLALLDALLDRAAHTAAALGRA